MTPHRLSGAAYRPQVAVDREFIRDCIGGHSGKARMVLVGDSFAHSSAKHMAAIAQELDFELRLIYGYSCPYPFRFRDIRQPANGRCNEVDEGLLRDEVVSALRQGDLLVIRLYFQNPRYIEYRWRGAPPPDAYDRAISELGAAAAARGAKLLVLGTNPGLSPDQGLSLRPQWFNVPPDRVFIRPEDSLETRYFHSLDEHMRKSFASHRSVSYFSVKPFICGAAGRCRIADGSRVLYSDDHHLSPYAHDLFYEDLLAHVRGLAANDKL